MGGLFSFTTPATLRRAFFIGTVLAAIPALAGPPAGGTAPPLAQVGKPDAAESARILDQFRRSGWSGYVEFEFRSLPRRGEETVYRGRLWGGHNAQGAITRIEVTDAQGTVRRFLLQNGERPAVWRQQEGKTSQVEGTAVFEPLIAGVEITAFDLQMPYLYWPDVTVENIVRMRGRPAYTFVFQPSPAFSLGHPSLKSVRAYFDAQFNAPVQTELVGGSGVTKTMSLVDVKKVGEQWIPRSFDLRNEVTRDKTRFQVTAVGLNLDFAPMVFAPAGLADDLQPPAANRIVRIQP